MAKTLKCSPEAFQIDLEHTTVGTLLTVYTKHTMMNMTVDVLVQLHYATKVIAVPNLVAELWA